MDNKYKHKSGALKSKERAEKLVATQKITKIDRFLCRPIANDSDVGERKVLSADSSCTDENNNVWLCPKVHANPLANSLEIHCKETGAFRQVFTPPQQKLTFSYHDLGCVTRLSLTLHIVNHAGYLQTAVTKAKMWHGHKE